MPSLLSLASSITVGSSESSAICSRALAATARIRAGGLEKALNGVGVSTQVAEGACGGHADLGVLVGQEAGQRGARFFGLEAAERLHRIDAHAVEGVGPRGLFQRLGHSSTRRRTERGGGLRTVQRTRGVYELPDPFSRGLLEVDGFQDDVA